MQNRMLISLKERMWQLELIIKVMEEDNMIENGNLINLKTYM